MQLRAHHAIVFSAYKQLLDPLGLVGPDVLEIGCGPGELTARMIERYGGTATLLDSSPVALRMAAENFRRHGLRARLLKKDIFKSKAIGKFDVVHSEGLIEHFEGARQKQMVRAHSRAVRPGGYVLICVPRPKWYYSIWRARLEARGRWPYGHEVPMTAAQLTNVLERAGLHVINTLERTRYTFALAKV